MKNKKIILSSILSLVLCLSLIAGGTFALFTSESKTNIAVTSGTVKVVATIDEDTVVAYSPTSINMDGSVADDTNAANGNTFKNGGSFAYVPATETDPATFTLTNITPGDKVDFNIDVENQSNVTIQYRVVISDVEGGSLNGLVMKLNGNDYAGTTIYSDWAYIGAQGTINSIPVSIELPANAGDVHQNKTTKLSITVEAVQGNAKTETPATPPTVEVPGTLAELQQAFADAATQSSNDIVIELTQDFDAENGWTAIAPEGYNGVKNVVVNGNGHKITNLNDVLFVGSFAGNGTITINDLTIESANISRAGFGNNSSLGFGAFIGYSDSSGTVTLNNCHLVDSTINCTSGYAGGLVGYVSSPTVFTNCSVSGSTISGNKSAGALIGHGGANVTVNGATVTGNTISETLAGRDEAGAATIAGRMSGGTLTLKGTITTTGNTVNQGAVAPSAGNIYTALGTPVTDEATLVTE